MTNFLLNVIAPDSYFGNQVLLRLMLVLKSRDMLQLLSKLKTNYLLLNRDTLSQIPWFINIQSLKQTRVVGN